MSNGLLPVLQAERRRPHSCSNLIRSFFLSIIIVDFVFVDPFVMFSRPSTYALSGDALPTPIIALWRSRLVGPIGLSLIQAGFYQRFAASALRLYLEVPPDEAWATAVPPSLRGLYDAGAPPTGAHTDSVVPLAALCFPRQPELHRTLRGYHPSVVSFGLSLRPSM